MRTVNSIKNIYISILTQIAITFLGFLSRRVFLDNLGTEYLGVNGLLTNVLSMLSLVEGGVGASIVYNLYKPLAEDNKPKVIALIQLYKKIYSIIAIIIFVLSIMLYPFLGVLMKDSEEIKYIGLVYFIFVLKNVISYLNAHKWSLINADQKGYILAKYNLIFNIITTLSKIGILIWTSNYILYLGIELMIFTIQNIWNGVIVNKRYLYIKTIHKYKIDNETRTNLIANVKAIFLHNVGGYFVFGTDNILISALVNLKSVGLYSNYTMIINQLSSILSPIVNGIGASVGNLIATESKEKAFEVFNITYLINFWIYSITVIGLYNLLNPFIDFAFGKGLLLDKLSLVVILINCYLNGMRSVINIFKTKAGIFVEDKYIPLIEAIINLVSSLILVRYFGLSGILLGTMISTITVPLWTQSKLVYNKVFNKSVSEYFKKYISYVLLTLICGIGTTLICNVIIMNNKIVEFIIKGVICIMIPSIIYIMLFYKNDEFKYIIKSIKILVKNIKIKKNIIVG